MSCESETVERSETFEASPEEVWESLTDDDRLSEWLAEDVELEPFEGGEISVRDGDEERSGTVETVIEEERLTYTWARPGEAPSRVDFTIEAVPAGTRLTVIETAVSGPVAISASAWRPELEALRRGLALVLA